MFGSNKLSNDDSHLWSSWKKKIADKITETMFIPALAVFAYKENQHKKEKQKQSET